MKTPTVRRLIALLGYVSLLGAMPALAQVGPIQPVLVLPDGKLEVTHDRPSFADDFSIPVDVFVAADGSVSGAVVSSSERQRGRGWRRRHLHARTQVPARARCGQQTRRQRRQGEREHVQTRVEESGPRDPQAAGRGRARSCACASSCARISSGKCNRIKSQAGIKDFSLEVMPYMSAHMYVAQKNLPSEVEEKFWDSGRTRSRR